MAFPFNVIDSFHLVTNSDQNDVDDIFLYWEGISVNIFIITNILLGDRGRKSLMSTFLAFSSIEIYIKGGGLYTDMIFVTCITCSACVKL